MELATNSFEKDGNRFSVIYWSKGKILLCDKRSLFVIVTAKTLRQVLLIVQAGSDKNKSVCLQNKGIPYCTQRRIVTQLEELEPGDFRSWESPQTFSALFIGPFEHVELFQNLKFAVKRITNIQSTILSSSEGTAAIFLAFK